MSVGTGIVATFPMLLFLAFAYRSTIPSFVRLRQIVDEILGRQLAACRWFDLAIVALLAGVSEEFLFRGVLESIFRRWGVVFGVVACNVLFGICHAVTPGYGLLAGLFGCYFSLTMGLTQEPNLVVPIVSHGLYDFVAFVVVANEWRRNHPQGLPEADESVSSEIPHSP